MEAGCQEWPWGKGRSLELGLWEIREPPLGSSVKAIHLAIEAKIGCPLGSRRTQRFWDLFDFRSVELEEKRERKTRNSWVVDLHWGKEPRSHSSGCERNRRQGPCVGSVPARGLVEAGVLLALLRSVCAGLCWRLSRFQSPSYLTRPDLVLSPTVELAWESAQRGQENSGFS